MFDWSYLHLPLIHNYIMAAVPIRQIRISDELNVSFKITVSGRVRHAEYFAQRSDSIRFKHFHIHALGYTVLYFAV